MSIGNNYLYNSYYDHHSYNWTCGKEVFVRNNRCDRTHLVHDFEVEISTYFYLYL